MSNELCRVTWIGTRVPEQDGDYWFEGERYDAQHGWWLYCYLTFFAVKTISEGNRIAYTENWITPVSLLRGRWGKTISADEPA